MPNEPGNPYEMSSDSRREQSTIVFPYLDLDSATEVTKAIYRRSGHGVCELNELAAEMNQVISGAFRLKTGTARIFDLIEKEGKSGVKITELGRMIVMPETEKSARADSFLRVQLYSAIFEKYKGHLLPPPRALEREMQTLGVSSKQTDKARQAFERSARQAGYFEMGDDRLIRPKVESGSRGVNLPEAPIDRLDEVLGAEKGGNKKEKNIDNQLVIRHPFIEGLLKTLPEPDSEWPTKERIKWLKTAANMFDLIYQGGNGDIEVRFSANE